MSHFYFAVDAFAFRQFVSWQVSYFEVLLMTRIAEMCRAKAKPNGFIAAVSAFVFDVVCAVYFAIGLAGSFRLRCAFGAQERLFNEIVDVSLSTLATVLPSNKVRILALEALVIRERSHRKLQKIVFIWIALLGKLFVLFQIVIFCPF